MCYNHSNNSTGSVPGLGGEAALSQASGYAYHLGEPKPEV